MSDLLPPWHPATARAGVWALRAIRAARSGYARGRLGEVTIPAPPSLPAGARRGVLSALARTKQRCLVRSTVLQAWEAAHDNPRDLILGVTAPAQGFRAHAWLDGDDPCHHADFAELTRRPPHT